MQIHTAWRPFVLVLGATESNSFAEVTADTVHFRFGSIDGTVSRADISGVERIPWWTGIGHMFGQVGLAGSHHNVVRVRLSRRVSGFGVFPCNSIAISLQDPDGFLAALKAPA